MSLNLVIVAAMIGLCEASFSKLTHLSLSLSLSLSVSFFQ